ncbi:Long palate, lung and nasal epithelium carcinoma-associated protein 4 [Chelonia mydas]|uniref:Long palate, lung and nasal epithelium carcinoma-associated protein 4 n=1 Tax=Chelonia mydas TaxID=8469 RepID=M7BYP6_CHEMY|nr:Long palate, lung and nasal epithelium carcinoma-associated protein 4 [Chelonia mydas]
MFCSPEVGQCTSAHRQRPAGSSYVMALWVGVEAVSSSGCCAYLREPKAHHPDFPELGRRPGSTQYALLSLAVTSGDFIELDLNTTVQQESGDLIDLPADPPALTSLPPKMDSATQPDVSVNFLSAELTLSPSSYLPAAENGLSYPAGCGWLVQKVSDGAFQVTRTIAGVAEGSVRKLMERPPKSARVGRFTEPSPKLGRRPGSTQYALLSLPVTSGDFIELDLNTTVQQESGDLIELPADPPALTSLPPKMDSATQPDVSVNFLSAELTLIQSSFDLDVFQNCGYIWLHNYRDCMCHDNDSGFI